MWWWALTASTPRCNGMWLSRRRRSRRALWHIVPSSPPRAYAGQGANQALEDALALATSLAPADRASVPEALRIYESLRRERTAGVQAMSRTNRAIYEASTDLDRRDREFGGRVWDRTWI